jgi:hypothetical protein
MRRLFQARRAIGSPEIHDHYLTGIIRQLSAAFVKEREALRLYCRAVAGCDRWHRQRSAGKARASPGAACLQFRRCSISASTTGTQSTEQHWRQIKETTSLNRSLSRFAHLRMPRPKPKHYKVFYTMPYKARTSVVNYPRVEIRGNRQQLASVIRLLDVPSGLSQVCVRRSQGAVRVRMELCIPLMPNARDRSSCSALSRRVGKDYLPTWSDFRR